MKYLTILLSSLLILLFQQSALSQFTRIEGDNIDHDRLEKAMKVTENIMNGLKSGNIYLLSIDEATEAVVDGMNEETQQKVYKQVTDQVGAYQNMRFVEVQQIEDSPVYTMYRFRGSFEKSEDGPEIRSVLDENDKLAGFWILPWQDELTGRP